MLKRHIGYAWFVLGVSDVVTVSLAWMGARLLRTWWNSLGFGNCEFIPLQAAIFPFVVSVVLLLIAFRRFDLYRSGRMRSFGKEALNLVQAVVLVWGMTYVVVNFTHRVAISRLMMASLAMTWLPLALLDRLACWVVLTRLRRRGWNVVRAAIVGTGRLGQTLAHVLRRNESAGISPQYFLDSQMVGKQVAGLEVVGSLDNLDNVLAQRPVEMVFVALPGKRNHEMEAILDALLDQPVEVRVVPDLQSIHSLRREVTQWEDLSVITLTSSPQHGINSVFKRLFDIVATSLAIAVMAIPMLLIAVLIKATSKGPVFYRQVRRSLGGSTFSILKFRTMVPDAEAKVGAVWASPGDPRVTRIGRILRKTSMDELPQLFNILSGQMSLVGPRPERPELVEVFRKTIPRYMLRYHVKAGLTGWAQVHGLRGRTSLRKRIQYDLYYITNWSFRLDLLIVLMTPFRGLISPHAY